MLKELLKSITSFVVSGLSRIAPRTTNRHVEYDMDNIEEKILTYKLLIVPEQDTVMVLPNAVPYYNWAISAQQEQELSEVFTRIRQEGLW
jgi:hypothetical protein